MTAMINGWVIEVGERFYAFTNEEGMRGFFVGLRPATGLVVKVHHALVEEKREGPRPEEASNA